MIRGGLVNRFMMALLLAVVAPGAAVSGHHSFSAYYFEDQSMSVEGELVMFEYRSPHAWVHIMVKDESGSPQKFSAEWASPTRLNQRGVTQETLKPGDWVVIAGSPGRIPAERRLHLKSIQRPSDGWSWWGPGGQR